MNGPSLQRLTLLSIVIHLTFFVAASVTIKKTSHFVMPSPYIVSLVGSGKQNTPVASVKSQLENEKDTGTTQKNSARQDTKEDKHLSDVMSALEAKKKVETSVRMRNIISLRGSGESSAATAPDKIDRKGGSAVEVYRTRITNEIHRQWEVPPGIFDKDLEAEISINILKDGSVQIKEVEKRSGSPLFDRLAIKAITKSSPLPPPPYEMEIVVRFNPYP